MKRYMSMLGRKAAAEEGQKDSVRSHGVAGQEREHGYDHEHANANANMATVMEMGATMTAIPISATSTGEDMAAQTAHLLQMAPHAVRAKATFW